MTGTQIRMENDQIVNMIRGKATKMNDDDIRVITLIDEILNDLVMISTKEKDLKKFRETLKDSNLIEWKEILMRASMWSLVERQLTNDICFILDKEPGSENFLFYLKQLQDEEISKKKSKKKPKKEKEVLSEAGNDIVEDFSTPVETFIAPVEEEIIEIGDKNDGEK